MKFTPIVKTVSKYRQKCLRVTECCKFYTNSCLIIICSKHILNILTCVLDFNIYLIADV